MGPECVKSELLKGKIMTKIPTVLEMLETGMHFGHRTTRWHPKMKPYLFGERQGVHVINLEITAEKLKEALEFVRDLSMHNRTILFLGTKRQAQSIIKAEAERCGMPYITGGWIGGLLTNFDEIGKLLERYRRMKSERENGEWEKFTKKERVRLEDDFRKKDLTLSGIAQLKKLPDAMFAVDLRIEKTAIEEARKTKMPVVAIVDSNVNPELVTHPIPANDDAVKSIALITKFIADAVIEGRAIAAQELKEETKEKSTFAPMVAASA